MVTKTIEITYDPEMINISDIKATLKDLISPKGKIVEIINLVEVKEKE